MRTRDLLIFDAPDGTYRVYDRNSTDFLCCTWIGKIVTLFRIKGYKLSEPELAAFLARQGTRIGHVPKPPPPSKRPPLNCGNFCPICGRSFVGRPPYVDGFASYDSCACCGFEYGFHDHILGETFETWRAKWIDGGAKWPERSYLTEPPGWDAAAQLRNIGIDLDEYR